MFLLFEQSPEKLFQGPITRLRSVTPRAFLRDRGSGSLRASSPGAPAVEREKEEELANISLWNLNSTSNFPVVPRRLSCQISANQREAETSTNVNKH